MCPGVVLGWEAFNAAVVDCDAEQARCNRMGRLAAAAMPEADADHPVPPERRFGLLCMAALKSKGVHHTYTRTVRNSVPGLRMGPDCADLRITASCSGPHPMLQEA